MRPKTFIAIAIAGLLVGCAPGSQSRVPRARTIQGLIPPPPMPANNAMGQIGRMGPMAAPRELLIPLSYPACPAGHCRLYAVLASNDLMSWRVLVKNCGGPLSGSVIGSGTLTVTNRGKEFFRTVLQGDWWP